MSAADAPPASAVAETEPALDFDNDSATTSADEASDSESDLDSSLGADVQPSTMSLRSSILRYREENGRTYHAYKDGAYLLPNDDLELDRLDLQHNLFLLTMRNRLHLVPLDRENPPQRVLDIGTGTGIWAIDFADNNPASTVIGVDLSPVQPSYVPPNAYFQIEDIEEHPWTFSQKFDFIHSRMNTAGVRDFPALFRQAYRNLNPGGWIEVTDSTPAACDDGTLTEDSALIQWCQLLAKGTAALGTPFGGASKYKDQLREAGFVNVNEVVFKWPTNEWARHPRHKELGTWSHENAMMGLEALCLAIFTRVLLWPREKVDVLLAEVRNDLKNKEIHAYWPM
ncbi:methyltransferase domain-containing protein [Colletotrichum graminicola M1.001]|uniref:Methyltransferase domain-containing protein n=1 Tax=Colletotrichum graminicola (strain M1.001 / M2 / FGSC 10212) TaxID=645133 RepID=E3QJL6_COLGM|nr:methyltransferase domain-containing protein [Colletotrichum graminicola M1.001]EFQ31054.1 methyltransferase domain-containing protein [Colletotrichum graminicola M1.001]